MTDKFTLYYFDLNARADCHRMLLTHAGVQFKDSRIE